MVALASNRISHEHYPQRTCLKVRRHFAVAQIKAIGFVPITFGPISKLRLLTLRPWSRIRDERPGCREMDRETDGEKYAAGRSKQVSCTKVSTEGGRSKSDSRIS
ncbi:hypothetical protein ALC60_07685 [Trachymyrmex zeteki]|uniref:Uncharacterized protein n=1 Tax=Mycetomoellerius zeteki TaxID=64791 RepID=A0A151WYK3_9HYME|nr:hypothetical protein ALC60_07685 [Trachymyrmex zeteki]